MAEAVACCISLLCASADQVLTTSISCFASIAVLTRRANSDLQDNDLDIKAMPEFVHLMKDGTQMSGMQFNIIVESAI